jgi:hypothetical protein
VTSTVQQAPLVSAAASSPCSVSGGRGPPARGVGERDVRMPREKPCAPGHGLGMFILQSRLKEGFLDAYDGNPVLNSIDVED